MEFIYLSLSVLTLIGLWRFCLRKTIIDHHRDILFDLRDLLRSEFIKNNWDLNHPSYKLLRDLLNGSLRFIENSSLLKSIYIISQIDKNVQLKDYLKTEIDKEIQQHSLNEQQKELIREIRSRCGRVIQSYMVFSSGWLLIISTLMVPPIAIVEFITSLAKKGLIWTIQLLR